MASECLNGQVTLFLIYWGERESKTSVLIRMMIIIRMTQLFLDFFTKVPQTKWHRLNRGVSYKTLHFQLSFQSFIFYSQFLNVPPSISCILNFGAWIFVSFLPPVSPTLYPPPPYPQPAFYRYPESTSWLFSSLPDINAIKRSCLNFFINW